MSKSSPQPRFVSARGGATFILEAVGRVEIARRLRRSRTRRGDMIKGRGFILFAALVLTMVSFGMVSPAGPRSASHCRRHRQAGGGTWARPRRRCPRSSVRRTRRLVSLRVQSASPLLFDVALVKNTGTYNKAWWWYYGLTAQDLAELLHGERCAHRQS